MKRKWIILYLAVLCLFCGCGRPNAEEAGTKAIESKTVYNDFIFTLTAEKVLYSEEEAGNNEPFSYKLEMEYTGNKRLLIWYGESPGYVDVMKGGKPVYLRDITQPLNRLYLEKGDHITITEWTGWHTEDEENLTAGIYTAEGEISFQIGEVYENELENNEYVYCRLELPLIIQ